MDLELERIKQRQLEGRELSENQKRYLVNFEKLKNVKITPGMYTLDSNISIVLEVVEVNEEEGKVLVKTVSSGHVRERTLHWCKKRLTKRPGPP
tara:strand:+ start:5176 stop:5457 length:282 start_codon:yes stop_codon:yes gene_type:complete